MGLRLELVGGKLSEVRELMASVTPELWLLSQPHSVSAH